MPLVSDRSRSVDRYCDGRTVLGDDLPYDVVARLWRAGHRDPDSDVLELERGSVALSVDRRERRAVAAEVSCPPRAGGVDEPMTGLFVPLDVNYYEDSKIRQVGPMAELLYVRSLAFVKRPAATEHSPMQQSASSEQDRRVWPTGDEHSYSTRCGRRPSTAGSSGLVPTQSARHRNFDCTQGRRHPRQSSPMASPTHRDTVCGLQVLHRKCDRIANRKLSLSEVRVDSEAKRFTYILLLHPP